MRIGIAVVLAIGTATPAYAGVLDGVRGDTAPDARSIIRDRSGARLGTTEQAPSGRTIIRDRSGSRIGTAERYDSGRTILRDRSGKRVGTIRSEEHTSELQSLMRTSYAVFCLKKKKQH